MYEGDYRKLAFLRDALAHGGSLTEGQHGWVQGILTQIQSQMQQSDPTAGTPAGRKHVPEIPPLSAQKLTRDPPQSPRKIPLPKISLSPNNGGATSRPEVRDQQSPVQLISSPRKQTPLNRDNAVSAKIAADPSTASPEPLQPIGSPRNNIDRKNAKRKD